MKMVKATDERTFIFWYTDLKLRLSMRMKATKRGMNARMMTPYSNAVMPLVTLIGTENEINNSVGELLTAKELTVHRFR